MSDFISKFLRTLRSRLLLYFILMRGSRIYLGSKTMEREQRWSLPRILGFGERILLFVFDGSVQGNLEREEVVFRSLKVEEIELLARFFDGAEREEHINSNINCIRP